ncbi:MAG: xanthine dehydrogenase accessory protein XdhC [Myxococcaceae bacterium]|nr:xanthine dehydrogenase accessory protein XdhC [Myxococcaceae bacterium]
MTFYARLQQLLEANEPFVLCTVTASHGSTPQKPGSKLVVRADGGLIGTVGGGAIEQQIVDAALALLADDRATTRTLDTHLTHELGMCCGGRMTVFLEKHVVAPSLVVFGAGHVAKELAALALATGFRVTVVDERPEWANAERFPGCELRLTPCDDVARAHEGGADTYYCVTTHDHGLDQRCVEALLETPSAYLGVIGSRRKAERFKQRLRAAGFDEAHIERLECPMGVDIGALTPVEIGVSIVARLVAVRRAARTAAKRLTLLTTPSPG